MDQEIILNGCFLATLVLHHVVALVPSDGSALLLRLLETFLLGDELRKSVFTGEM